MDNFKKIDLFLGDMVRSKPTYEGFLYQPTDFPTIRLHSNGGIVPVDMVVYSFNDETFSFWNDDIMILRCKESDADELIAMLKTID